MASIIIKREITPTEGLAMAIFVATDIIQAAEGDVTITSDAKSLARRPEVPVGGRLMQFAHEWHCLNSSLWLQNVISLGYKLEFRNGAPPFNGIVPTVIGGDHGRVL